MRSVCVWLLVATAGLGLACHPPIKSTLPSAPTSAQLAQLWIEPDPGRDLFWGVGGKRLAPDPSATYTVIGVKRTGFSSGYDVEGPGGREWSAKFPPEALTEVVASRIHWGIGYHQPPIYYVKNWSAEKAPGKRRRCFLEFRQRDSESRDSRVHPLPDRHD